MALPLVSSSSPSFHQQGGRWLSESRSFSGAPLDVTGSPSPRGEPLGYVAAWEHHELGQKAL